MKPLAMPISVPLHLVKLYYDNQGVEKLFEVEWAQDVSQTFPELDPIRGKGVPLAVVPGAS